MDSITAGKWARYQPREVRMPAVRLMEKDPARQSHWFDLRPGQMLEGLLLEAGKERRIYAVTSDPPEGLEWVHVRWPRLG